MSLEIRKIRTVVEEVHTDGGKGDGEPVRKAAVAVVVKNPYAGRAFSEDLSELVEPSAELGTLIGDRATEAVGGTVESHGKAVLVGLGGEQEHGNAIKTTTWGNPFREAFGGPRWETLAALGARVQRPLWASTSTKDPTYPDTLYVDTLIGPDTVNTLPDATLEAFEDHGTVARTVDADPEAARAVLADVSAVGVDLADVARVLEEEGVAAFIASFDDLLASLAGKAATFS